VRFSANVAALEPSPTLAVTARASQLRSEGREILDLSAGEPSFPTPDVAAEAAAASVRAGKTGYPPTPGIPELRRAVVSYLEETTAATTAEPANVLVSVGVKQALFNLCFCLFADGDEVLVPAPYWPSYLAIVQLSRARPVVVQTPPSTGFALTPELLEEARTPATRGLILNSPGNPTGAVHGLDTLEAILEWAERNGIWVLSDEIYRRLHYAGSEPAPSVLDVVERGERVVAFDGVSKAFSMPGWRIGWAVGPSELVSQASALQSQTTSGAAAPSQHAAAGVLVSGRREEIVLGFRDTLARRRAVALETLSGVPGIEFSEPEGALYVYFRTEETDTTRLAERLLLEIGVASVPGEAFGTPGWLRINFAASDEVVAEGTHRIAEFFRAAS
jgi:aspartate/methionine/tyrosine aminotransferase